MLQRVAALSSEDSPAPSALVLVPTRELAMQVAEAVHRYGKSLQVHVLPINGGQAMQLQLRAFSMKPMRCWTWGFAEDLEAILTTLPPQRQTALFSATIAPRIASIAKEHLRDPVRVTIVREAVAP